MNIHYATETAYKNGYEAGVKDTLLKISAPGGSVSKREFGEPIKMYLVEEERLLDLLAREHIAICGVADPFEYFWDMMVESGCDQHVTHKEFVEAVKNMTFGKLAEMDLALYEEYKEKCGDECQFKFKPKPTKPPVDNH